MPVVDATIVRRPSPFRLGMVPDDRALSCRNDEPPGER
jgi:hypothetical protein